MALESFTKASTDKTVSPTQERLSQYVSSLDTPSGNAGDLKTAQKVASLDMVAKKTLPDFDLTGLPKVGSTAPPKDWTLAIDLAASIPSDKDHPQGWGVDHQLQELKKLAKETEGKSVNYVVHAERPIDAKGEPCSEQDVSKIGACETKATETNRAITERYFIHDGKIDKLPTEQYASGAADLKALLQDATKLSPSTNLGLVIQSHGVGTEGIETNLGPLSLDKTINTIESGLKGSGHSKLDLLDFNACDMAAAKVLDKSGKVAKNVVASASEESASDTNDGQNMVAAIGSLLANSKMTGKEFGDQIVMQAKNGADGTAESNTIHTLANFDLSHYDQFKKGLDGFGAALADSAKNPNNVKLLQKRINDSLIPVTEDPAQEGESHNRDLKALANGVLDDIKANKFSGNTDSLRKAAESFVKDYDSMATQQWGDKNFNYDGVGGLTATIPGNEILDTNTMASTRSPLHHMISTLKQGNIDQLEVADKAPLLKDIDQSLDGLKEGWGPRFAKELKAMKEARNTFANAEDLPSFKAAFTHLQTVVSSIDAGPAGKQTLADMKMGAKLDQRMYLRTPIEKLTPGWDRFVKEMSTHFE